MLPITFLFDGVLAFTAIFIALRCIKVWWAYIIAGELTLTIGLSMIFHYVYVTNVSIESHSWYYLYSLTQGIVLLMLLFCLTMLRFLMLYLFSAVVSFSAGVLISNGHDSIMDQYSYLIGISDLCKVGLMVDYWLTFVPRRHRTTFNRLHIWQN